MSASEHLSELQFQVHRGLKLFNPQEKVDTSALGMHWSASPDKAREFATKHMHWPHQSGVVIKGTVPVSATETDTKLLGQRGFAGFGAHGRDPFGEQEVPVREGSKVLVHSQTKYRRLRSGEMKERTRRYKTPREMTA